MSSERYGVLLMWASLLLGPICAILLISSKVNTLHGPTLLRDGFVNLHGHSTTGQRSVSGAGVVSSAKCSGDQIMGQKVTQCRKNENKGN